MKDGHRGVANILWDGLINLCDVREWDLIDLGESRDLAGAKDELRAMLEGRQPMTAAEEDALGAIAEEWRRVPAGDKLAAGVAVVE